MLGPHNDLTVNKMTREHLLPFEKIPFSDIREPVIATYHKMTCIIDFGIYSQCLYVVSRFREKCRTSGSHSNKMASARSTVLSS